MENAIKEFIESVPKGCFFDSHSVITYLIQRHSDIYLGNYCKGSTSLYHGYIGQVIRNKFVGELIIQLENSSWSKNIHDEFSECTCWQRI